MHTQFFKLPPLLFLPSLCCTLFVSSFAQAEPIDHHVFSFVDKKSDCPPLEAYLLKCIEEVELLSLAKVSDKLLRGHTLMYFTIWEDIAYKNEKDAFSTKPLPLITKQWSYTQKRSKKYATPTQEQWTKQAPEYVHFPNIRTIYIVL